MRLALEGEQKAHDLGIEAGGETRVIGIEDEPRMSLLRRRQHRRGIEDLRPAEGRVFHFPTHAAQVTRHRFGQRRDHLVIAGRNAGQAESQHPAIGKGEPQPGLIVGGAEDTFRQPQPRTHRGRKRPGYCPKHR